MEGGGTKITSSLPLIPSENIGNKKVGMFIYVPVIGWLASPPDVPLVKGGMRQIGENLSWHLENI